MFSFRMEVSDRNTRGLRGSHLWPYVGWAKTCHCGWPWFYLDEKNTWNPMQQTGSHVPTGLSALRKWHKWGQDICRRDVGFCLRKPDLNTASAAATSEERWIAALICIPQQLAGEKAFMTDWKCIFCLIHKTENWKLQSVSDSRSQNPFFKKNWNHISLLLLRSINPNSIFIVSQFISLC